MQAADADELGRAWVRLLEDAALRENMGRRARQLVEQNAGAALLALQHIETILGAPEVER
jgi:hypothetical protein